MSLKRTAKAHWNGTFKDGQGNLSTQTRTLSETPYSFRTRFQDSSGTNPEELIAAAHAGCFTMAVSNAVSEAGFQPGDLDTEATVDLDTQTLTITNIHLDLKASAIEGLESGEFEEIAENAKANCIVSRALSVPISLKVQYR